MPPRKLASTVEDKGRVRVQPLVSEETHLILRTAAAIENTTIGRIIDQWAATAKETRNAAA